MVHSTLQEPGHWTCSRFGCKINGAVAVNMKNECFGGNENMHGFCADFQGDERKAGCSSTICHFLVPVRYNDHEMN